MRTLVWFRGKDLRVGDHEPLHAALEGGEVIPLFVVDPFFFAPERARELPHRMQFLVDGLQELGETIAALGSRLIMVAGRSVDVVPRLAAAFRVDRVVAQRWVEPFARERDRRIRERLQVPFDLYEGETLAPLGRLKTGADAPYCTFTPYKRAFLAQFRPTEARPAAAGLPALPSDVRPVDGLPWLERSPTMADLELVANPRVQGGGERRAHDRLRTFLAGPAAHYEVDRNRMDLPGTSRLSADLKFGTLSVRTVWNALQRARLPESANESFANELLWREFAHELLWTRPDLLERPFRREFERMAWSNRDDRWQAWVDGRTGYPIVDAAQRQLRSEGYVHNRARMITASFLTKHLDIDFRRGEAHFLKWLTDGDWAQNDAGWQWSTGCGCDAAPYFRIFNPVTQGEKFDPAGDYVRRYVPELASLPAPWIHAPWTAPALALRTAGVDLGRSYPTPIVDHAEARAAFLAKATVLKGPVDRTPPPAARPRTRRAGSS